MCGIAGKYNYSRSEKAIPSESDVQRMLSVIQHRGPDETGMYLDDHVALGAVRLGIIDIAGGQQPMCDESGEYWIVYNGEIFNHKELKKELEKKGVRFKTNCDTEVVVQMFAVYGSECLKFFNGQFAFAIWNEKKQELFLARDRFGIRPLFYWRDNSFFAFCSEIKGLFTLPEIGRSVNINALAEIFTIWTTTSPHTPFSNIYELPPGHYLTITPKGINIRQYWSLNFTLSETSYERSFEDIADEFAELLKDAVKIRLRADVQVAAYLSGGLDSCVITSLIKDIHPGILNTFSIGFNEKEFDESGYQKEAANFFDVRHTSFVCTAEDIANEFSNTIWHTEFPILRTSPTPMMLLSKKVREQNIKVVLTGEGSDEILGGYNIYKENKVRRFWANQPSSTIRPKLLSRLYPYLISLNKAGALGPKMFFGYKLQETSDPLYSHLVRWNNTSRIRTFFSDEVREEINNYDPLEIIREKLPKDFLKFTDLGKAQYLETSIFMCSYLLSSQGDRMSMANSVEGRYPFLDYRLFEFCSKIPDRFKLNALNEKFILKKISYGKIPQSVSKRSKQPYRAPITTSLLNEKLLGNTSDLFSENSGNNSGLFNPQKVRALINKIKSQNSPSEIDQMAIAGILSTELIYKLFIVQNISGEKSLTFNKKVFKRSRTEDIYSHP